MAKLGLSRAALAAAVFAGASGSAAMDARAGLPGYALVGSYALPAAGGPMDVLPDGRLVTVQSDGVVLVQSALNSGTYAPMGMVSGSIFDGPFGNFGASFVSVSPDGLRLAIGDNGAFNRVHFVEVGSLAPAVMTPTTFVNSPNYDGAWADGSTMYVSGFGSSAGVWRVDVGALSATQVVTNAAGGSGGVAVRSGNVFIGDGFNTNDGGSPTGNVRAFELGALAATGTAVDFGTGTLVADALSASPVRFDVFGNMLVGGGDFFAGSNDFGYAAVIDADAIASAMSGGPLAPDSSELRLSPAGGLAFYGIEFNEFTGEVLVFADGVAYRYAVPAPATGALFGCAGIFGARRRRR